MAASDKVEAIVRMMDQDNDGEALNALRLLRRMASGEKKNLAEFLKGALGATASTSGFSNGFDWQEAHARSEANRRANEQARAEEARQEQRRREREARKQAERESRRRAYSGMYDDAEMSDDDRENLRRRRANERTSGEESYFKNRRNRNLREILDKLAEISKEAGKHDLEPFELDFVMDVPFKLEADYEMSFKQKRVAEAIIRKWQRNQDEAPI